MSIEEYKPKYFESIERIYNLAKPDEFLFEEDNFSCLPLKKDSAALLLFEKSRIFVFKQEDIWGFSGYSDLTINWLYVDPVHRRKNVARALLEHVLSSVEGNLCLNVASSNIAAKNLYNDLGFSVIKTFIGNFSGKPISVDRMELVRGHS